MKSNEKLIFSQFCNHFSQIYGEERWNNTLLDYLRKNTRYCCLINSFADPDVIVSRLQKCTVDAFQLNQLAFISLPCLIFPNDNDNDRPFPPPERDFSHNLKTYYLLDAASVLLTEVLNVQPHHNVLDLCAAPGGKSLTLAFRLFSNGNMAGTMTCNEFAPDRRKRLHNVLLDYLPEHLYRNRFNGGGDNDYLECPVRVTGFDGTRYSRECNMKFDRILVDAPCSSERHLLHQSAMEWSAGKSKNLAAKQLNILTEAVKCLKVGGILVYATCSLSEEENDGVVGKCLAKFGKTIACAGKKWNRINVEEGKYRFPIGEPTNLGWIVLPDSHLYRSDGLARLEHHGWGPLYFTVIQKKSEM